jgi:thymidylate synthase (FAD)
MAVTIDLKVITEPTLLVLGRQQLDQANIDTFVKCGWRSDSDVPSQVLMEVAGRTCYQSFKSPRPGGNKAYISHIIETQHGSVCEHAVWTFGVEGVSRSFSHELERHRAGVSPSELSQRYVDCSDVAFVVPPAKMKWYEAYQLTSAMCNDNVDDVTWTRAGYYADWLSVRMNDLQEYERDMERLLTDAPAELTGTDRRKWARQAARDGLPNCTETKLVLTMNARAIRNVLEQRGSRFADAEIRRFANVLYDIMLVEAPHIFADYETTALHDGTRELNTKNRKV